MKDGLKVLLVVFLVANAVIVNIVAWALLLDHLGIK